MSITKHTFPVIESPFISHLTDYVPPNSFTWRPEQMSFQHNTLFCIHHSGYRPDTKYYQILAILFYIYDGCPESSVTLSILQSKSTGNVTGFTVVNI
jgi:hypothetical protein